MNVTTLCKGGLGVLQPENLEKIILKTNILRLLGSPRLGLGEVIRFSHQICTDLKNGPDEFKKA